MRQGEQFFTLPQIAKRIGVTERRADYAARSNSIEPIDRIGIIRLFDLAAEQKIRDAINRIGARREGLSA